MNQFLEWVSKMFGSWKFWVVIPPWDIGVRIRLGKNATKLCAGAHWRIPFLDEIILVNTRLRITTTPSITITSSNVNKVRTLVATIGFSINDPIAAMLKFELPAAAVQVIAQAEVAKNPDPLVCGDNLKKKFLNTGIEIAFIQFVEDVEVPSLRLLQGGSGVYSDHTYSPQSDPYQTRY